MSDAPYILAGMTLGTLHKIKAANDEDLQVTYAGPHHENGKYAGWIIEPPHGRGVVNTDHRFETSKEAEEHMHKVIKAAKEYTCPPLN